MTTLPNMGLVLPTRGAPGAGQWGDTDDANSAKVDAHDHSTGKGTTVKTNGISIDADLTFSSLYAPINLHRITFASIVALSSNNKSLFVSNSDNELYWRSNAGTNVKLTNGASLNVSAFTGGIGGDYASVGAAVAFDDAGDRYTFKQNSPGFTWARLACGDVRLFETGTTDSVFVGLAAPAALAGSYTITMPLAAPGSTSLVQMDSSGVLTASNTTIGGTPNFTGAVTMASTLGVTGLITATAGVTAAANQHVTVSGTGEYKHGDRVLTIPGSAVGPNANVSLAANGQAQSSGAALFFIPIQLHVGDRIKSVTFARFGDGAVDLTVDVGVKTNNASTFVSIGSNNVTNAAASWVDTTVDTTDTVITSTTCVALLVNANGALAGLDVIRVTYDHP